MTRMKHNAIEKTGSGAWLCDDPYIEEHFLAWLHGVVPEEDQDAVEAAMRKFVSENPELILVDNWSWPDVLRAVERNAKMRTSSAIISRSSWEEIGVKTGWMRTSETAPDPGKQIAPVHPIDEEIEKASSNPIPGTELWFWRDGPADQMTKYLESVGVKNPVLPKKGQKMIVSHPGGNVSVITRASWKSTYDKPMFFLAAYKSIGNTGK